MKGIRCAILGTGRSGQAAAQAALSAGASVTVLDERTAPSNPATEAMFSQLGVAVRWGFSGAATRNEFDVLVTSPGVRRDHPILVSSAKNGVEVIGEIELAFRISRAPIVAITGTNGKSTTTVMTWLCLKEAGASARLCGNIFGSGYEEVPLTLAACQAGPEEILVAEISSFQLEWISQFCPIVAGITNLSSDHQDRYASFDDYAATKHRIYSAMQEGVYVHRAGDAWTAARQLSLSVEHWTFGAPEAEAHVGADYLRILNARIPLNALPFHAPHDLQNAMMAGLMAAAALRITRPEIEEVETRILQGLSKFQGLAHRMQRVGEISGIEFINNSMCTNAAAIVASSRAVDKSQHLLVGGRDKQLDFSALRDYLDLDGQRHRVYLFGSDAANIAAQIGGEWPEFSTLAEAFTAAAMAAKPGEAVMLAPGMASMDQFSDFRERGELFVHLAKEWQERCLTS